jgi:TetR/AcrR family transcriptional regulator, acrAB operon repressor
MARRSKSEAEETREQIVAAAIKLFLRDGVSKTTLEKIAEEAGYTRGAVYHHFENKAKLMLELMKRAHPPAQEMFDSMILETSDDPLGTLSEKIGSSLEKMLSDNVLRDIHTIFIYNCEFVEKTNPIFEPECKYGIAAYERLCECLEQAMIKGQLKDDVKIKEAALAIIAFCFGLISMELRKSWYKTPKIDNKRALAFFIDGMRKDAACNNVTAK